MSICCKQSAMGEDCLCNAGVDMTLQDTIPQFAVDLLTAAEAEREAEKARADALAEKLKDVMIGGNHLAHHLPETVPPPETHPLDALEELGAGVQYDIWCAWRSIMLARATLAKMDKTDDQD